MSPSQFNLHPLDNGKAVKDRDSFHNDGLRKTDHPMLIALPASGILANTYVKTWSTIKSVPGLGSTEEGKNLVVLAGEHRRKDLQSKIDEEDQRVKRIDAKWSQYGNHEVDPGRTEVTMRNARLWIVRVYDLDVLNIPKGRRVAIDLASNRPSYQFQATEMEKNYTICRILNEQLQQDKNEATARYEGGGATIAALLRDDEWHCRMLLCLGNGSGNWEVMQEDLDKFEILVQGPSNPVYSEVMRKYWDEIQSKVPFLKTAAKPEWPLLSGKLIKALTKAWIQCEYAIAEVPADDPGYARLGPSKGLREYMGWAKMYLDSSKRGYEHVDPYILRQITQTRVLNGAFPQIGNGKEPCVGRVARLYPINMDNTETDSDGIDGDLSFDQSQQFAWIYKLFTKTMGFYLSDPTDGLMCENYAMVLKVEQQESLCSKGNADLSDFVPKDHIPNYPTTGIEPHEVIFPPRAKSDATSLPPPYVDAVKY
ncbi:hypothetical protein BU17DRAFT_62794 [Hysterangium stoloniferum]|nr:hypothetical protein BU17DRAFT_62794 [Hysterangium stoloniferum]